MRFVRPGDTQRPTWVVYEHERYLGTVHAHPDGDGLWHVQSAAEQFGSLDDAVRVLRKPPSGSRQRQQVARWARAVLADPALLLIDVQTAGLGAQAWAVQNDSYLDQTQPLGSISYYRIVGVRTDGTETEAAHPWRIRPHLL
ncbi:hypothetical protein [Streptomyces sp. NPDC002676]